MKDLSVPTGALQAENDRDNDDVKTKAAVVKFAKKSLKRHESDTMKLKSLAKLVAEDWNKKYSNDDDDGGDKNKLKVKVIQEWISANETFAVDGKLVRLSSNKKRKKESTQQDANSPSKKVKTADESSTKNPKATKNGVATTTTNTIASTAQKWRQEHRIVIKSATDDEEGRTETIRLNQQSTLYPWTSFEDCKATTMMEEALIRYCTHEKKFTQPSPIQSQCWPLMCASMESAAAATAATNNNSNSNESTHQDVVGIAETGSGKTLAFALPILSSMYRSGKSNNNKKQHHRSSSSSKPRLLVLCPTRELAMQTQAVLDDFCPQVQLQSVVIYGGVPKSTQKQALRQQVDAIVATPGRLQDLLQDGSCDLSQVEYVVLDEADRMLEYGFEEEVRNILSHCPDKSQRQTCMFSATWPACIQKIAMDYMVRPVRVYVGFAPLTQVNGSNSSDAGGDNNHDHLNVMLDDSLSANKRVQQIVEVIEDRQREERLRQLLRQYQPNGGSNNNNNNNRNNNKNGSKVEDDNNKHRILVFCLYKKEAERLEITLRRGGWNCSSIHGNKNQAARTLALSQFKDGSVPLLVATDVAARGLDIPDVQLVVNFTFPLTIEDYVHRIGRTGRQGKTGVAHTFFQPTDKGHAGELQSVLRQAGQDIPEPLAKFGSTIKRKEHKLYGNFGPKDSATAPMKKATKITFNYSDDEQE